MRKMTSNGTTTSQLWQAMQQDCQTHRQLGGVFPNDHLYHYRAVVRPQIIFVNTAPERHPGKHWVALYFPANVTLPVEFFDSTGKDPLQYRGSFKEFLTGQRSGYIYNKLRLQRADSDVCGEYCLYYAIHRCHGNSMRSIVASVSSDEQVYSFVHKYFQM